MSKANPYDRLVGFIRFHNIHINEEMKLRDIVKEIVAFEKPQPPSQSPQTPIDREPEAQSIIDKCETAVEVLRTMLNKLKMPLGVEAADNILTQIKGYKVMNPKEDTGPYSMPMPAQEPFPQTPRTPISQPGELDTVGEHPSDKEGEGKDLGECQDCQKRPATKDYNGHGYFVCDPCYKSLSNEFDEEYK